MLLTVREYYFLSRPYSNSWRVSLFSTLLRFLGKHNLLALFLKDGCRQATTAKKCSKMAEYQHYLRQSWLDIMPAILQLSAVCIMYFRFTTGTFVLMGQETCTCNCFCSVRVSCRFHNYFDWILLLPLCYFTCINEDLGN